MNKREWMLQSATAVVATGKDFDTGDMVVCMSNLYDAIVAASGDEGWIEHRGEKPYPEGMVEVRFRNGAVRVVDSDGQIWSHDDGHPMDIVAWRPAT